MTFQKMTNDIIDYRRGVITMEELRARYPTWKVPVDDVKFCVEAAIASPIKSGRVK